MYRFDATISSAVEDSALSSPSEAPAEAPVESPLSVTYSTGCKATGRPPIT